MGHPDPHYYPSLHLKFKCWRRMRSLVTTATVDDWCFVDVARGSCCCMCVRRKEPSGDPCAPIRFSPYLVFTLSPSLPLSIIPPPPLPLLILSFASLLPSIRLPPSNYIPDDACHPISSVILHCPQGDEPLVDPSAIDALVMALQVPLQSALPCTAQFDLLWQ